jgi:glyoxylase-like metal-dependent hydrolase (beta-lactamase superfamily II)
LPAVRTFVTQPFWENAYLLYDRASREAYIVDPGGEEDAILAAIASEGLRPIAILNTHAHPDHVAVAASLRRRLSIPFRLHPADAFLLDGLGEFCAALGIPPIEAPPIDEPLRAGEEIALGSHTIRVIETPGHSPGSVSFLVGDLLFSGDAVFQGSIGRTDLPGGSLPRLLRSIREQILTLPEETRILSGHGEPTTVGAERVANPFLNGELALDT